MNGRLPQRVAAAGDLVRHDGSMKELRCPVCGAGEQRVLYAETFGRHHSASGEACIRNPEAWHYRINRCPCCDLEYASPIFDEAVIRTLYTDSHRAHLHPREEANVRRTFELYYDLVRPHIGRRRRMLDVGCDVGLLLGIARRDGFQEVIGLEPNAVAASQAARIPACTVSRGFYEATAFPPQHFDLVTLIHVLDHMVDVNVVLSKILHELGPGGVALAVVHNVGSLLARLTGERFPPYNLGHNYYFSKSTLRRVFDRAGFQVTGVFSTSNRYSLGFLMEKAPAIPAALRDVMRRALAVTALERLPLTVRLGNIAIVARKPA